MTKQSSAQSAIATVRAELADLRAKQDQVNAHAQIIRDEIRSLHDAPIAPEDLPRYVRRFVNEKGEEWASRLRLQSAFDSRIRADGGALHTAPWGLLEQTGISSFFLEARGALAGDAFGSLCFFFPDVIEAKLTKRMACASPGAWIADAMPVAQREARIAELRAALGVAENEGRSLASQIGEITTALDS